MINIDADQTNADWIKTVSWEYPVEAEKFLWYIGGIENLPHFMTLPVARAMPDELTEQLFPTAKGDTVAMLLEIGDLEIFRAMTKHGDHDQSTHGNRGGAEEPAGEPGSSASNPIRTTDVDEAARALAEGKYVDLDQPRGLSTLTDKLAAIGQEAKALGSKAPLYDLGKVTIQGTNLFMNENLGVPRAEMPQFTGTPTPGSPADSFPKDDRGEVDLSEAYKAHLADLGVTVSNELVPADVLRATQSELDGVKVSGMMDAIESGKLDPTARTIWTTKDDYVLDGHHLWAATVGTDWTDDKDDEMPIRSNVIDMKITDVLKDAQEWTAEMGIAPRAVGKYRAFLDLLEISSDPVPFFKHGDHDQSTHGDRDGAGEEERSSSTLLAVPSELGDLSGPSREAWAKDMERYGVTIEDLEVEIRSKIDQDAVDHAKAWYPAAHETAADISARTGIPLDQVAGAMSAMSGRCEWQNAETGEGEVKYLESMAGFVATGRAEGLTTEEAVMVWKAEYKEDNDTLALDENHERTGDPVGAKIMNSFAEKGMDILTERKSLEEALPENKQRSFFDNIMDPEGTDEVTADTHMFKTIENVYGVSLYDATKMSGHDVISKKDDISVNGTGYVAISEAVRTVAKEYDVAPSVVQAAYWEQVQAADHISHEQGSEWPSGLPATHPKSKG